MLRVRLKYQNWNNDLIFKCELNRILKEFKVFRIFYLKTSIYKQNIFLLHPDSKISHGSVSALYTIYIN